MVAFIIAFNLFLIKYWILNYYNFISTIFFFVLLQCTNLQSRLIMINKVWVHVICCNPLLRQQLFELSVTRTSLAILRYGNFTEPISSRRVAIYKRRCMSPVHRLGQHMLLFTISMYIYAFAGRRVQNTCFNATQVRSKSL